MPSAAEAKYAVIAKNAAELRNAGSVNTSGSLHSSNVCFHASLATYVGGWEIYVEELVREYYRKVSTSNATVSFMAIHTLAASLAETAVSKFNTPNWENSRNLIVTYTAYDPIAEWVWSRRNMSSNAVKDRLTEILKVRHSFAHGHQIPSYSWTSSPTGKLRITKKDLKMVEDFFSHLVSVTDIGMARHIQRVVGVKPW